MKKSKSKNSDSILIVGAGIAGIKAAFDVAELGHQVYLVDSNPFLGGTLSQLDRQFPTNRCCMCQLLPTVARHGSVHYCLRRELYHPNITTFPGTTVTGFSGETGNFEATLTTTAVEVDPAKCTNCGACAEVCPEEVQDEFNGHQTTRKAIYAKYPLPIPNIYAIDKDACTRCGKCVEACPTNAINLEAKPVEQKLDVASVILASGFEEFDPKILMQYGHGRYADVLTSIELERMFSGYGSGKGDIFRPSDGTKPKKIAFLQCVGSRDHERDYCSAACCMYAMKEAMIIREENPDLDIRFFYMDARAYGKGYHRFMEKSKDKFNVVFTRSRIPVVKENPATRKMVIKYLNEANQQNAEEFDLIVLSIGQVPPVQNQELAQLFGLELNQWGFCQTDAFNQVKSTKPGVFVCGAFNEPKDIPESVAQASSAAFHAASFINLEDDLEEEQTTPFVKESSRYDKFSEEKDWDKKTAILVCKCGGEIAKTLDTKALAQFGRKLSNVVLSEEIEVLCSTETLKKVTRSLEKAGISRVVFAACVPYHYQHLFEEAAQNAGIDPGYIRVANIREHAAWPHQNDKAQATTKAREIVAMHHQFLQKEDELALAVPTSVAKKALVIGAGPAGMSTAAALANFGIDVDLIEKSDRIGGRFDKIYYTPHGKDPLQLFEELKNKIENNSKIQLHLNTEIKGMEGSAGAFLVQLKNSKPEIEPQNYGAVIVATGGEEHLPTSFEYGKSPKIVTQQEFKDQLKNKEIDPAKLKQVVMIQCVESRNNERPYCSRICCTQAITNALKIKELNPDTEVIIFNRDIMTYGFREQYYTKAREEGVFFIRYEPGAEPKVASSNDSLQIKAKEPVMQEEVIFSPDYLVLSTGIDAPANKELSAALNLPLDKDNFFQEAEVKFRPVDFHKDGVFVAGVAHSPRFLEESITQGYAAAARAATLLLKDEIPASPLVAEVNPRRCSGCQMCIPTCVYGARVWDEETHITLVKEALCQACGACAMVCPNNACKLRGYRDKQVLDVIDTALQVW